MFALTQRTPYNHKDQNTHSRAPWAMVSLSLFVNFTTGNWRLPLPSTPYIHLYSLLEF